MTTVAAPWWFCDGWSWRSATCVLDVLTGCRIRRVCAWHDRVIAGRRW